jgi:molybdopterin-guanine dinucleotide biosynthesis protein A
MGQAKAMLPFGPQRMLTRVAGVLGEVVEPLVVVAARGQPLPDLPKDVLLTRDRREAHGPLEGLAAGLAAIAPVADAAYVTGCDVPLLRAAFVRRMIALVEDYQIVVPRDGTNYHPLAAVYRVEVLSHVQRLLAENRLRPIYLLEETRARAVPVEELREVDPELCSLENLNRPADYLAALEKAGFAAPEDFPRGLDGANPP